MRNNKTASLDLPSGIIPYCKKSGLTSFSSLSVIKKALGTSKVGHTGTLDSFADGLLVVLAGNLTHLVEHVTSFTKTYLAVVCFGKETDTLDPAGEVIKTANAPGKVQVQECLKKFTGPLLQTPPLYSALHVDGKRASDLVRSGQEVHLEPRQIFVYKNELLDFLAPSQNDPCSYALLEISCSKGTYIRSLARDIAASLQSCACLIALRRTQVGPFKIEDSAFYKDIETLSIQSAIKNKEKFSLLKNASFKSKEKVSVDIQEIKEVRSHFFAFTPSVAELCGLDVFFLKTEYEQYFMNGRPLKKQMFSLPRPAEKDAQEAAVFYKDNSLAGIIRLPSAKTDKYSYGFVVQKKKKNFRIYTWQDIIENKFNVEYLSKGTAISVGSFDGVHKGHQVILKKVLEQKEYARGCVTFLSPAKLQSPSGEISSVEQKIQIFSEMGFDFAIVIDFSPEFSKMEGTSFVRSLVELCSMRFIAEGQDFCCGYKGSFKINDLFAFAEQNNFKCCCADDVEFEGKRISSTRIRDALAGGNLPLAKSLIGRDFSYDCTGLDWKEEDGCFCASSFSQRILPSDGTYDVIVKTAAEDSVELNAAMLNTMHVQCRISKKKICLFVPTLRFAQMVKEIIFKE